MKTVWFSQMGTARRAPTRTKNWMVFSEISLDKAGLKFQPECTLTVHEDWNFETNAG